MVAEIQMETQKNTEQAQIHMKGKKIEAQILRSKLFNQNEMGV